MISSEERIRELSARIVAARPGEDLTAVVRDLRSALHEYIKGLRTTAVKSFPRGPDNLDAA